MQVESAYNKVLRVKKLLRYNEDFVSMRVNLHRLCRAADSKKFVRMRVLLKENFFYEG